MVKSPLNYPGNKTKVIRQITQFFPKEIDIFVDAFCGSGIVAFNSGAKKLVCNDINSHTIELLKYLYKNRASQIIKDMDTIIQKFKFTNSTNKKNVYFIKNHEGLSKYNKIPFTNLKNEYNKTKEVKYLFALVIFSFNHFLRFNKNNEYNVPVGKVDFHKVLRNNTNDFARQSKKYDVEFLNLPFTDNRIYKKCTNKSLVYFDPPYLITTAPYNDKWTANDDKKLFQLFDKLSKKGIKVIMSNVFYSNGKANKELIKWSKKYNVINIKRQYRNANYQKKNIADATEVLITNFKGENYGS